MCVLQQNTYRKLAISDGFSPISNNKYFREREPPLPAPFVCFDFLLDVQTDKKKESTLNFDEGCGSKIRWTPFLLAHSGKDYSHIYYLLNAF